MEGGSIRMKQQKNATYSWWVKTASLVLFKITNLSRTGNAAPANICKSLCLRLHH